MGDAGNWCLIESDPGVFTELISRFGVQGIQVEELCMLDEAELAKMSPIYGLIFLFKIQRGTRGSAQVVPYEVPGLYFAQQVIQNACATQAILNILMNAPHGVDLGPELSQFKEFTQDLPSELRGLSMSNSDSIRAIHNSFARQETFTMESRVATEDDDLFHFIAYVPHCGRVYELDGCLDGPVDHGAISGEDWISAVVPVIQQRIGAYAGAEIRFNLMAVIKDRAVVAAEKKEELEAQILSLPTDDADDAGKALMADLTSQLQEVEYTLQQEAAKRLEYQKENQRRKHNYIPMFLELLRGLAKTDQLKPLAVQSQEKAAQERAQAMAKKAKAKQQHS